MEMLFAMLFSCFLGYANFPPRLCDDFSDADLLHQIPWTGDTGDFIVNENFQLQLNAPSGGRSAIFFGMPFLQEMQWELDIRLDFSPSATNRLIIFLMSETPDPDSGNAWFLEIGETGTQDPVRLYRRENGSDILVGESTPAVVAEQPVEMKLRVTFTGDTWKIYSGDQQGILEFLFSAREEKTALEGTGFFGLHCIYSASRSDRFYFDNLCIGPFEPDTVPPDIISLNVPDPQTLEAGFSEEIADSGLGAGDFNILPGDIMPVNLEISGNRATLFLDVALADGKAYTLHIRAISDTSGNSAYDLKFPFRYHHIEKAKKYEWLIHEVMPDPNPAISLPDAEYIELFHNGLFTFDLGDYRIRIGNRVVDLPRKIVQPGTYLILCASGDTSSFQQFGMVTGVGDMPALPNAGAAIGILDQQDSLIHSIQYDRGWYRDPEKDDGGWSLEMINTSSVCSGAENWRASNDLGGGTPGRMNSVEETWPDLEGPVLLDIFPLDSFRVLLSFDEDLNQLPIDPSRFACKPDIGILDAAVSGANEVVLKLSTPLRGSVIYSMFVEGIPDCLGNPSDGRSIQFGLPEPIDKGDLVINEVLFNPATGGSRFVELLNRSGKVFRSDDVVLGKIDRAGEELVRVTGRKLILPGELIAFSADPADILNRYDVPYPGLLLRSDLPGWGNDADNVTVLSQGIVIDSFTYREEWHHPLLADVNGVSLERISKDAPSGMQGTWHSAASTSGFATPTGENSQAVPLREPAAPFHFESTTFSPDNDGYEDALLINFRADMRDAVASVYIHDHSGRFVRSLARNAIIGANEALIWDGTNENGEIQRVGTYLVLIELFTAEGDVQRFKDVCVLAGKF